MEITPVMPENDTRADKWVISDGSQDVAVIWRDPQYQVGRVEIFANATVGQYLQILRLAASHVRNFRRYRRVSAIGGAGFRSYSDPGLTDQDSEDLMHWSAIDPSVQSMTIGQLRDCLIYYGVQLEEVVTV